MIIAINVITLVGSWGYAVRDYPTTIAYMEKIVSMNIPIEYVVTHKFPLDKITEAMETNIAMSGLKIAIVP